MPVLAADRDPGDEVVDDEVVQDDDAGPPPQRVDDPAVRVRVVADVVERDVRGDRPRPPGRTTSTSTSRSSAGRSSAE